MLPLEADAMRRVSESVPGLVPLAIPDRTYGLQQVAVDTLAATALLVVSDSVPDASVKQVLDFLFKSGLAADRGVSASRLSRERATIRSVTRVMVGWRLLMPAHPVALDQGDGRGHRAGFDDARGRRLAFEAVSGRELRTHVGAALRRFAAYQQVPVLLDHGTVLTLDLSEVPEAAAGDEVVIDFSAEAFHVLDASAPLPVTTTGG